MYLIQIQKAKFPKTGELKFSSWITTPATPVEDRLPPELAQCGHMITCRHSPQDPSRDEHTGVSQLTMNSAEVQSSTNHAHLTAWGIFLQSLGQLLATGGPLLSCPLSLPHIVEIGLLLQRVVKLHTNIYRTHSSLLAALKESTTAFVALMSPSWYCRVKIRTGAHQSWKPWTTTHPITRDCTVNGPFPTSFLLWLPAVIELSLVWVVGLSGEEVWLWLPLRCRLWGGLYSLRMQGSLGNGEKSDPR